jgi:hypothetical protein
VGQKIIKRDFAQFGGVDMKADDINRPDVFSPQGNENILFGPRGEIRRFPIVRDSHTSFQAPLTNNIKGLQLYKWKGTSYGEKSEKILGWSDNEDLIEIARDNMVVSYSGGGVAEIQVGADTGDGQVIYIWEDDVLIATIGTTSTISAANTTINGLTDFSCTIEGTDALVRGMHRYDRQVIDGSITLKYDSHKVIPEGHYVPGGYDIYPGSTFADKNHVMGDSVVINGCLYMNILDGTILKYDGHYWYRAGMPALTSFSTSQHAGGSLTALGTYTIAARSVYIDAQGNTHYGPFSFDTVTLTSGNNEIRAVVAQTSAWPNSLHVTITAVSGTGTVIGTTATAGNIKVGDKVCLYTSSGIAFREVVALAANSVTLDQSVSYNNGDDITHRSWIEVYSTIDTGGQPNEVGPFYLIAEHVAISHTETVYINIADSDMVNKAILTDVRRWNEGPPKGTKLTKFQGSLVLKDFETDNIVHFSDQQGPEQFDLAVNNFTVEGDISGIGATKEHLAIFKEDNCDVLTGDIQGFSVRVDRIDDDIGCIAHQTIKNIDEGFLAFVSKSGPYRMVNGVLSPLGIHVTKSGKQVSRIEPWFKEQYFNDPDGEPIRFAFDQATALHWSYKNLYIFSVPIERTDRYFSYDTYYPLQAWAYDYEKDAWLGQLNEFYMNAGGHEIDNEIYFLQARNFNPSAFYWESWVKHCSHRLDKIMFPYFAGSEWNSKYVFNWFHFGAPSQLKKFNRVRLITHEAVNGLTEFNINLKTECDFKPGVYGTDVEGVTMTIGEERKIKIRGQRARALRITIESASLGDFAINGISLEYAMPYRIGMKE